MSDERTARVAIVNYELGNVFNVLRACTHVGLDAFLTADPDVVRSADAVLLPGVGAMPYAMDVLNRTGMANALREVATNGTPLFGVCLGMQLLMTESTEFARHPGLGILPGSVTRFEGVDEHGAPLKVPHIGWSAVERDPRSGASWDTSPLSATASGEHMYFVHSYRVIPDDPTTSVAQTRYGNVTFCSAVARGNVFACQFHPERSGPAGLAMYAQFARSVQARLGAPVVSAV